MKEYKIYQHLDKDGVCIYVGLTTNMRSRQNQHKTNSTHWEEIATMLYAPTENKTTMLLYEQYYINKLNPKYNKRDKRGDSVLGIQGLVELDFQEWTQFTQGNYREISYLVEEGMPSQLDIIKYWENLSVSSKGEVVHYKDKRFNEDYVSLWEDYGEARCMGCSRDMGGAYEGLAQSILDNGEEITKQHRKDFPERQAQKMLNKIHIDASKDNTPSNLLILCTSCSKTVPPPTNTKLFYLWLYSRKNNWHGGIHIRDNLTTLSHVISTYPSLEDVKKAHKLLPKNERRTTPYGLVLESIVMASEKIKNIYDTLKEEEICQK